MKRGEELDLEDWRFMGISEKFAEKQLEIIEVFRKMGVSITCTCTPYLAGNAPSFGEHLAWAESSAVCYANSVIGARTNREGGPSALAAAIIGKVPRYGLHLDDYRKAGLKVNVSTNLRGESDFGGGGVSSLTSMLQACPLGVATVNIDAGVAAGAIAAIMANRVAKFRKNDYAEI